MYEERKGEMTIIGVVKVKCFFLRRKMIPMRSKKFENFVKFEEKQGKEKESLERKIFAGNSSPDRSIYRW